MFYNVPGRFCPFLPMVTTDFVAAAVGSVIGPDLLVPSRIPALTCIAAVLPRKTGRTRLFFLFLLSAVHRTIFPFPPRRLVALRRPLVRVWGVPAAGRRRVVAVRWTYRETRAKTHPAHVSAAISKNILPSFAR